MSEIKTYLFLYNDPEHQTTPMAVVISAEHMGEAMYKFNYKYQHKLFDIYNIQIQEISEITILNMNGRNNN